MLTLADRITMLEVANESLRAEMNQIEAQFVDKHTRQIAEPMQQYYNQLVLHYRANGVRLARLKSQTPSE